MKGLAKFLIVVAVMCAVVLIGTWPVRASFASKAKLIQVVQKGSKDDLFADGDTPIGSPQVAIVDDERAFLPGKTEGGASKVDDAYMQQKGLRPLQLQTVDFVTGIARLGSGIAAFVFGLIGALLSRKAKSAA